MERLKGLLRRPTRATPGGGVRITDALEAHEREIVERALPYTMTTPERIVGVLDSVDYVLKRGIPGAFAECGVWRGGSVLAMILALQRRGESDRHIYLYDTFAGMTEPTEADTSPYQPPAASTWERAAEQGTRAWPWWFGADIYSLEQVREVLEATGYPPDRLHFVVGPVEETLPAHAPPPLALLRLDTDWYESTRHELSHLYPMLNPGGVLIIDDYGDWEGARRAVDEYFAQNPPLLLSRLDYTGRLAVKW